MARAFLLLFCSLPLCAQVRVAIETEKGRIVVEVDTRRARVTAANFLKYVDAGGYDNGAFHRTVTPDNQPKDTTRIEVIQASAAAGKGGGPPIALERTMDVVRKIQQSKAEGQRLAPPIAIQRARRIP